MKQFIPFFALFILSANYISAQGIAISDQPTPSVSAGAVLDVSSGSTSAKGFLPPRITSEKKAVSTKTEGLLYFFSNSKSYGYWTSNGWCSFVISGPYKGEDDPSSDTVVQNIKFTPLGGLAIKVRNVTGSPILKGMLVKASTTDDNSVILAMGTDAFGVAYENISDNPFGWIVISGVAEVLPYSDITPVRGDRVRIHASQYGYADFSSTPSNDVDTHSKEIGYCIKGATAGQLARVLLQF